MQVADALSKGTRIKSGVPQWSVVGLLLILLFVNDLPSVINVPLIIFLLRSDTGVAEGYEKMLDLHQVTPCKGKQPQS